MKLKGVKVTHGTTKVEHVHWQQVAPNVVLVSIQFATKRPRHIAGGNNGMGVSNAADEEAGTGEPTWIEFETEPEHAQVICDGWDKWTLQAVLMDPKDCDPNDLRQIEYASI